MKHQTGETVAKWYCGKILDLNAGLPEKLSVSIIHTKIIDRRINFIAVQLSIDKYHGSGAETNSEGTCPARNGGKKFCRAPTRFKVPP